CWNSVISRNALPCAVFFVAVRFCLFTWSSVSLPPLQPSLLICMGQLKPVLTRPTGCVPALPCLPVSLLDTPLGTLRSMCLMLIFNCCPLVFQGSCTSAVTGWRQASSIALNLPARVLLPILSHLRLERICIKQGIWGALAMIAHLIFLDASISR